MLLRDHGDDSESGEGGHQPARDDDSRRPDHGITTREGDQ